MRAKYFHRCYMLLTLFKLIGADLNITLFDSKLFPSNDGTEMGEIVGLADINGDQYTDIFYLINGLELKVLIMGKNTSYGVSTIITLDSPYFRSDRRIRSILLGDFSGDSLLDVVILLSDDEDDEAPYLAHFIDRVGHRYHPFTLSFQNRFAEFTQPPLILYYDDDNVPDLLGMDYFEETWQVWKGGNSTFHEYVQIKPLQTQIILEEINRPMYSMYFDSDMDFSSDVMLTDYAHSLFKFYDGLPGHHFINFNYPNKTVPFPIDAKEISQPIVADWWREDGAGFLLAYCTEINCVGGKTKLGMYNLKNNTGWVEIDMEGNFEIKSNRLNIVASRPLLASMRTMDINLDNYPDVVTTLLDEDGHSYIAILVNECHGGKSKFHLKKHDAPFVTEVIPFDFMEDGVPDLLVNRENKMQLYEIHLDDDNVNNPNMLKVSMLPGHCVVGRCTVPVLSYMNSKPYSFPYGIPMTGVTVSLKAVDKSGDEVSMRGQIVSSSCYMAVQQPYHLFGLSKNISKIKSLTIAIAMGKPTVRVLQFVHFQVHVVFNPIDYKNPNNWSFEMISIDRLLPHLEKMNDKFFSLAYISFLVAVIVFNLVAILITYKCFDKVRHVLPFNKPVSEYKNMEET